MSEASQNESRIENEGEIDLREVFRVLWNSKWLIGSVTLLATIVGLVVALMLPNTYRSDALLAPNARESMSGLSTLASQYSGLASLAGLSLGSGTVDKTELGLQTLRSRKFISDFIERRDILVPLMAADGWNSENGELTIDAEIYDIGAKKWVRQVRPPRKTIPSLQEAYDEFMDLLTVNQDAKSGMVTVGIEFYSPNIARQWTDWLVQDLNSTIMHQDVAEAEQAIDYLNDQIKNTSLADLRDVFFDLIEEQTKTVMLASVTDEYLFKTVDPPIAPEEKSGPNRPLITLLGTVCGCLLTMLFVHFRHSAMRNI